jgi:hypothetical protein
MEGWMDARLTNDRDRFIFEYSPDDARDLAAMVDHFNDWEMIASADNQEPMLFLLRFAREVTMGRGAGRMEVSRVELTAISELVRIFVERNKKSIGILKRLTLNTAWKTLRNRLATA